MEKQKLNTTLVYILSLIGFLCCCFLGSGIVPSGIAFFMAKSKIKVASENYDNFENIEAMKTAKTVALVIFIINILMLLRVIYVLSNLGYDDFMEQYNETLNQWEQLQ